MPDPAIPKEQGVNRNNFATGVKTVAAHATAVQLQAQSVPDGYGIVIRAMSANKGLIYYGNSQANAQDHTVAAQLAADDFIVLFLTNVQEVWISSDNDGEGVTWTVEISS